MTDSILPESTLLGRLELLEVFVFYDEPRLFSCKNQTGVIFIAVWIDENEAGDIYYYVPMSRERYDNVISGSVDLREAFILSEDGIVFEVNMPFDNNQVKIISKPVTSLEDSSLPVAGRKLEYGRPEIEANRLDRLRENAKKSWREAIALVLNNPSFRRGVAPARLIGGAISYFQDIVYAAAQGLAGKRKTRLSEEIAGRFQLQVVGFFPSSFGVIFNSPTTGDLFGKTETFETLETVFELIGSGADEETLRSLLRAKTRSLVTGYRRFLYHVSSNESNFLLDWASPSRETGISIEVPLEVSKSAMQIVSRIEREVPREIKVSGELIGLNRRTKAFEIYIPKREVSIKGKFDPVALPDVVKIQKNYLYSATIQELLEFNPTTGEEKANYNLVALLPPPSDKKD